MIKTKDVLKLAGMWFLTCLLIGQFCFKVPVSLFERIYITLIVASIDTVFPLGLALLLFKLFIKKES